jgi:hypothetical protein
MDLPFLCFHVGHRPTRLSAGDQAFILLRALTATSGPGNNTVYFQRVTKIHWQK